MERISRSDSAAEMNSEYKIFLNRFEAFLPPWMTLLLQLACFEEGG